jgi:hypothetical protein
MARHTSFKAFRNADPHAARGAGWRGGRAQRAAGLRHLLHGQQPLARLRQDLALAGLFKQRGPMRSSSRRSRRAMVVASIPISRPARANWPVCATARKA